MQLAAVRVELLRPCPRVLSVRLRSDKGDRITGNLLYEVMPGVVIGVGKALDLMQELYGCELSVCAEA